ncbi:LamG-like jellyroll fold domain-containing protein [Umezawaea endophytica]|uniref:Polymorphic toxin-type HINT domain-containing protein n=1 Tax=Umezawaea endophytica TaxID=1654476 RepID=A0A9X2VFZ9_9PSEU|nr:LamG-like jellyroll fold domain-containing protein [Umezawaea endophytica]MCS7475926.1 polymorphic toxin-type HINT domain-containing protein [Umezawaea endophytica]
MTLVVGLAGPDFSRLPWVGFGSDSADQAEQAERVATARGLAAQQEWGTADGLPSEGDSRDGNWGMPVSERSKYATAVERKSGDGVRNTAQVVEPVLNRTGFDANASVEEPGRRERNERTYRNPDGTRTTEFSDAPLNYRRSDGTWAPIDPTLVGQDGRYRNKADDVDLRLAGSASAADLVTIKLDDAHELAYGLSGARDVAGRVDGATITYPGVADHVDLQVESLAGGAKETLVLHDRAVSRTWDFPLRLKGLTAAVVDGAVSLSDGDGKERLRIPAGFMTDSAPRTEESAPALSHGVRYEVVDNGRTLRVVLDAAWLDDPARTYPVLVDPSVFEARGTTSMYLSGTTRQNNPSELLVGNGYTSYVRFPGVVANLRNNKIFGAALQVVNFDSTTCTPKGLTVHPVGAGWGANGAPAPPLGQAVAGASFSHGFMAVGQTRSPCPAAPELIDLGEAGTQVVQDWANGAADNGLALRAVDSGSAGFKKFTGSNSANPPRLFVTHSPYNAKYVIDQPIPNPPVTRVQDGKVRIKVTNTGATAWTKSAYGLSYKLFDASNNNLIRTVASADLPRDTVAPGEEVEFEAKVERQDQGVYVLDFTMRHNNVLFTDEQVAPARITLQIFNIPPIVSEQYPPAGHSVETLQPQLWAKGADHENDPLQYRFEVCERDQQNAPVNCFDSGRQPNVYWTLPEAKLRWDKVYLWRTWLWDGQSESEGLPFSALITSVPQPEITSRMGNAPYTGNGLGFDPMVGNYTTAAVDAAAATVGPELNVARTYNSLDPRLGLAFGSGWSSRYDMRVVEDLDGSKNVVVTYPDGQQVRFGRNADDTYTAPPGRFATLTRIPETESSGWTLVDKDRTVYTFLRGGEIKHVRDNAGRQVEFIYDTGNKLWKATSRTSNRTLTFHWTGGKIDSVKTDPVDGAALEWKYVYEGDQLREVCGPDGPCTRYQYEDGSHYRSTVLDSRPDSYWRLGEAGGGDVNSQISVKLGKDKGAFVGFSQTNYGKPGAIAGSGDNAVELNGNAHVRLPEQSVNKHRDLSVELWFRGTSAGPLFGYQDKALAETPGAGVPVLYVGSDGRLRGQFWNGRIDPIATAGAVNDGNWHHVVLTGSLATQSLYLDGAKVGSREGVIDHPRMEHAQVGAAFTVGAFPEIPAGRRTYAGLVDELALYTRPLGDTQVRTHYEARNVGDQIKQVTMPSLRVAARVEYDHVNDRMKSYVDGDGGKWLLDVPTIGGSETNVIRSVRVVDPAGRPQYYDFDGLKGRILRQVTPIGPGPRPEDVVGRDCTTNPDGVVTCNGLVVSLGVRLYDYDSSGFQTTVVDEEGNKAQLVHDDRGNLKSKISCREEGNCQTTYYDYHPASADPTDPRADKLIATRDARSSGPTDNTYLTTSDYNDFGDLERETSPDGGSTFHTYTGLDTDPAVDSGFAPRRLLKATTDPRGATTLNRYYRNGDLAETVSPAGLRTRFEYDELGRKKAATEYSDAQPGGVRTTFKYDRSGRVTEVTYPATTNAVSGGTRTETAKTEYDQDGNTKAAEVVDSADTGNPRRSTFEFDEYGRMTKATGPTGNEASFGYDQFGNRTWAVDANGVKTTYTYTARNRVAQVRLVGWHGRAITPGATEVPPAADPEAPLPDLVLESNQYDHSGRLSVQVDAMGRRTQYGYFGDGLVKEIKAKADGKSPTEAVLVQQNTYDAAGNLVQQVGAGGKVVKHEVDATGRLAATVQEPDTLRRRTEYKYDLSGNITQVTRTGAYSNAGSFNAWFGEIVDFEYDTWGRQVKETLRGGATGPVVTRTTYDQRDLVKSVIAPLGNVTGAVAADHTTEYRYDERGRTASVVQPPVMTEENGQAPSLKRPTTSTGYNAFGEVTEIRNPAGGVMKLAYDKGGRTVRTESPSYRAPGAADPVVGVVSAEYDAMGRATRTTDPAGSVIRMYYDQRGRLVEKQDPNPANPSEPGGSWRYSYTHTGGVLSETDPTGGETRKTYDQFDRPVTSTAIELRPQPAAFETKLAYDAAGNLETVTSPKNEVTRFAYDKLGQRTTTTDPAGVVSQFGYDSFGNQVYSKDGQGRARYSKLDQASNQVEQYELNPAGQIIRTLKFGYDNAGNRLTTTDGAGKVTRSSYDALGKLVQQVEPVSATESITTSFGYDTSGRPTRFTDGRENSSFFTYNALGKLESTVEPSTTAHPAPADRTWTAAYDASGRPTVMTNPGGVTRTRSYDGLGRLKKETGAGASVATADREVTYDAVGRPKTISAPGGTNTYEYDNRGLLTATAGPSGQSSFTYDEQGRPSSRTDAAGTTGFAYTGGRLSSVQDGVTGGVIGFGYTASGLLETMNYGAGRIRTFGYDDFGRETSDVTKNAAGAALSSVTYAYDKVDRLTKKVTAGTAGAGEQTYTYDDLGRTLSWTSNGATTAYGWDKSGNRILNGGKAVTFDQRNRMLSDGDYTYAYTPRGTRASRTSSGLAETFDFDAFDRLLKVGATEYAYDGLDRPVSRGAKKFQYSGVEIDPVSDDTATYGRGLSGELLSLSSGADKRLLLSDKHGDVVGGLDPVTSTLKDSTAYDPWGKPTASTGTKRNVGFQGDWTDPDSGRVNMGARWYEPTAGSFISRDSVTQGGPGSAGFNRYVYGVGSPLNGFDPDGHGWFDDAVSWVGDNLSTVGHTALDVAGLVPGFGEIADGVNALWYLAEGNYVDAGLSAAGMIPFGGWGATAAKWGNRGMDAVRRGDNVPTPRTPDAPNVRRSPDGKAGKGPDGMPIKKGDVPTAGKAVPDPRALAAAAAAQRAAAAAAAWQAAVRRTTAAKAAVATAVKSNPMPAMAAALKPRMANAKNIVSSVPNAPARIVQATVTNVQDLNKVYDTIKTAMLGTGHEIIKEAVQTQVAETLATSGIPYAEDLMDLAGAGRKKPGSKGKQAKQSAAAGGSCTVPWAKNSFTADTPVLLADGSRKPIADIAAGDVVLATDPTTDTTGPREVTDTRSHQSERLLHEITITTDAGSGTLTSTDEHPFWVDNLNTWVNAEDLKPGYTFTTADNRPATVTGTRPFANSRLVYNLTVDGLHTYYVFAGDTPVLTHNINDPIPGVCPTPGVSVHAIPSGSSNGPGAGKSIPASMRKDYGVGKQWHPPLNQPQCAYCRTNMAQAIDHVESRIGGGDLTDLNTAPICVFCNSSKRDRVAPMNPPPNFSGQWPPAWWPANMRATVASPRVIP